MFSEVRAEQDVAGEDAGAGAGAGARRAGTGADPAGAACTEAAHATDLPATSVGCDAASTTAVSPVTLVFPALPFRGTELTAFLKTKTAFSVAFCVDAHVTHTRDCYLERAFRAEREAPATPPVGHERRGHHHHLLKQTRETSSPKPGNACLRPCGKGRRRERRAAPWSAARGASKSRAAFCAAAEVMQTQPLRPPHPAPPPPLPLSEAAGACRLDFF